MMADRLSELPDDLLRRILYFAPLKEAASTTALSRRWRAPLYLSSAAVNLEAHVEYYWHYTAKSSLAFDFLTKAVAALDAADITVTRLALRLESENHKAVNDFLNRDRDEDDDVGVSRDRNLVDVLLSHRAARYLEEFRLALQIRDSYKISYMVALDVLPLETLRVLELTECQGIYQKQGSALVLPRLSFLLLRNCAQHLGSLQSVIDSAPALAAIHLDFVHIYANPPSPGWPKTGRLRCPAATMLVLKRCRWEEKNCSRTYQAVHSVEIDAPRLHRFWYMGHLRSMMFSLHASELEQVDLHDERYAKDPDLDLASFWRLARSFSSTKEMKLWVNHLEEVAVLTEPSRVKLLPAFSRLQRLELRGVHWTKGDTAAVTIVNLLRCCPMLCALRISLTAEHQAAADASNKKGPHSRIPHQKIMQMPALGPQHALKCLQSSLVRVGLQIGRDESNCFAFKLIEFFAENAMVLKEMHLDEKLCDHTNRKTARWNSIRRKSGATYFVVIPHKK